MVIKLNCRHILSAFLIKHVEKVNISAVSLQVVGGKMTESGRLCAYITKVKKGSLADTVGHLRPGEHIHT